MHSGKNALKDANSKVTEKGLGEKSGRMKLGGDKLLIKLELINIGGMSLNNDSPLRAGIRGTAGE